VKKVIKIIVSYGLSLLFLNAILHVDPHKHNHNDGYSICDISCDSEEHHSFSHHCQKCLNKNNKLSTRESVELKYDEDGTTFFFSNESYNKIYFSFNLLSRPPPNIL